MAAKMIDLYKNTTKITVPEASLANWEAKGWKTSPPGTAQGAAPKAAGAKKPAGKA